MQTSSIFCAQTPMPEDLISYACPDRRVQDPTVEILIKKYCFYISKSDFQYGSSFWIYDPQIQIFPLESFIQSLENFLKEIKFWEEENIEKLKHEHMRTLVLIAALRYRMFPLPKVQDKFEKASLNGFCDIFLFDLRSDKPAHAIQIRLLTPKELGKHNKIHGFSLRGKQLLKKGIEDLDEYLDDSQISLNAHLYSKCLGPSENSTTTSSVLLFKASGIFWLECDSYEENLTSGVNNQGEFMMRQAQAASQNERISLQGQRNQQNLQNENQNSQGIEQNMMPNTQSLIQEIIFVPPQKKINPLVTFFESKSRSKQEISLKVEHNTGLYGSQIPSREQSLAGGPSPTDILQSVLSKQSKKPKSSERSQRAAFVDLKRLKKTNGSVKTNKKFK